MGNPSSIDPVFVASLIWTVVGLAAGYNQIRRALGKDLQPQPFEVRPAMEFCPLQLHQELKEEVNKSVSELSAKSDRIDDNRRVSVSKVYEHTRAEIGRLRAENKAEFSGLRLEIKGDIKGIHDRLTDVLTAHSRLEGKSERP